MLFYIKTPDYNAKITVFIVVVIIVIDGLVSLTHKKIEHATAKQKKIRGVSVSIRRNYLTSWTFYTC